MNILSVCLKKSNTVKMSTIIVPVEVPFGFKPDELLSSATPEQKAIILTTGCVALKALLSKTDAITHEEAYAQASFAEIAKWTAEKGRLEQTYLRDIASLRSEKTAAEGLLKKEIDKQKAIIAAAETRASTASAEAAAVAQSVSEAKSLTRTQVESEFERERQRLRSDLDLAQKAQDKAVSELRTAEKATANAVRSAEQQIRTACAAELKAEQDRAHAREMSLISRQVGSSTKGRDNEDIFAELVHNSFGSAPDYMMEEHRIESGDHIIRWCGHRLMFENKKYGKRVSPAEVDKAHRDFRSHSDCAVLIFVSEDSSISGHERPGHFDIEFVDSRPVIYIGYFAAIQDKVAFLQMLQIIIRELLRLQEQMLKAGTAREGDIIADYKAQISTMRRYFSETYEDLTSLVTESKVYQRKQREAWDMFKGKLTTVVDTFERRLTKALRDGEEDIGATAATVPLTGGNRKCKCGTCGEYGHNRRECKK